MGGTKNDAGKPATDDLDARWLLAVARVCESGDRKYEVGNWRGLTATRLYASVLRHLWAWRSGEDLDPETGESHLTHASAGLSYLWWHAHDERGHDDRAEADARGVTAQGAVLGGAADRGADAKVGVAPRSGALDLLRAYGWQCNGCRGWNPPGAIHCCNCPLWRTQSAANNPLGPDEAVVDSPELAAPAPGAEAGGGEAVGEGAGRRCYYCGRDPEDDRCVH